MLKKRIFQSEMGSHEATNPVKKGAVRIVKKINATFPPFLPIRALTLLVHSVIQASTFEVEKRLWTHLPST
jgi:hypothetical protein